MLDKGGSDPRLVVSGLPGTEGERREVSVASLGTKVLCDRHNSALSALDAEFLRLYRLLSGDDGECTRTVDGKAISVFNGIDLQKAMVKLALARTAGGLAINQDGVLPMSSDYNRLVPILFDRKFGMHRRIARGSGLYACEGVGRNGDGRLALESVPLAVRGKVYGDYLDLQGLRLALLVAHPPPDIVSFLRRAYYHPVSIELTRGEGERVVIAFGWHDRPAPIRLAESRWAS